MEAGFAAAPLLSNVYGTTSATNSDWGISFAVNGATKSTLLINLAKEKLIEQATRIYIQYGSMALKRFLYGKGAHDFLKGIYGNQVTITPEQFATAMDTVFHAITSSSLGVPGQAIRPTPAPK